MHSQDLLVDHLLQVLILDELGNVLHYVLAEHILDIAKSVQQIDVVKKWLELHGILIGATWNADGVDLGVDHRWLALLHDRTGHVGLERQRGSWLMVGRALNDVTENHIG